MLHPCKMFVEDEEEETGCWGNNLMKSMDKYYSFEYAVYVMTSERMASSSNFTCR